VRLTGNTFYAEGDRDRPEHNTIRVGYDVAENELVVTDTAAGVKAGAGCSKSGQKIRCARSGALYMYVYGAGGKDALKLLSSYPSFGLNAKVSGAAGNDVVRGGPGTEVVSGGTGNDTVVGGPSADSLIGGSGRDELRAKDGTADSGINCGTGTDPAPLVDMGLDPSPVNCE
jgi:Ca2+-binding RTX toxin-like protein